MVVQRLNKDRISKIAESRIDIIGTLAYESESYFYMDDLHEYKTCRAIEFKLNLGNENEVTAVYTKRSVPIYDSFRMITGVNEQYTHMYTRDCWVIYENENKRIYECIGNGKVKIVNCDKQTTGLGKLDLLLGPVGYVYIDDHKELQLAMKILDKAYTICFGNSEVCENDFEWR